jgi:hypothetical protein
MNTRSFSLYDAEFRETIAQGEESADYPPRAAVVSLT